MQIDDGIGSTNRSCGSGSSSNSSFSISGNCSGVVL